MKTVTQQFIDEQLKPRSKGIRCEIIATVGSESKDLTPYLMMDSLNRIEWNIEKSLTTFGNPDIQFTMWYDQEIWDWLYDNNDIEIEIKKGFPFEKITVFAGYIDRNNLRQDTLGTIFVRAYSMSTKAKSVIASIPGYVVLLPVRDLVESLFSQLNIEEENQTIKVKPFIFEDMAWSEFMLDSWGLNSDLPPLGRNPIIPVSDHKFFCGIKELTYHYGMVEFNEDYSDYVIQWAPGSPVNLIQWGDNNVAAIMGHKESFYYAHSGGTITKSEWILDKIIIYDYDFNVVDTYNFTSYVSSGYTYYYLAKSVYRAVNEDEFFVALNGVQISNSTINKCLVNRRKASDNSSLDVTFWTNKYINHDIQMASGYASGFGHYYLLFLNPVSSYSANNYYCRFHKAGSVWYRQEGVTSYNAQQMAGEWASLGKYVANDGGRIFNIITCIISTSGFWDYLPEYVWSIRRDHKWYLTGYDVGLDKLQLKTYDDLSNNYSGITCYSNVVPAGYDVHVGRFAWWFELEGNNNFAHIMRAIGQENWGGVMTDVYYHIWILYGNMWMPYVKISSQNDSIRTMLDELAKAFCCICHFPDNDTGIFMSRDYLPDTEYAIDPLLRLKQWYIYPQAKQKVKVNDTVYGEGERLLVIDSDYIEDNEVIRNGIAKKYYDFIDEWNMRIEFKGDFLIQYEPLDMLVLTNPQDSYTYRGRITKLIQEGNTVRFILRSKKV